MTTGTLVRVLRRLAVFQGLTAGQLRDIADVAERISFEAGDAIITEDEAGDAAFFLLSGECRATSGPAAHADTETVPVGSLIGEMAMLIDTYHGSTVVCLGSVQALKIPRAALHALMSADSSLAEHFVAKITGRLFAISDELKRLDRALAPPRSAQPVVRALPPPALSAAGAEAHH